MEIRATCLSTLDYRSGHGRPLAAAGPAWQRSAGLNPEPSRMGWASLARG